MVDETTLNDGKICRLLVDGGTFALQSVFDQCHPPIMLQEELNKPQMLKVLRQMKKKCVIDSSQWEKLFPSGHRHPSSDNFDASLLYLLLRKVCHLCPPYPNGWGQNPLACDKGMSGDVARLLWFVKEMSKRVDREEFSNEEFNVFWTQISEMLARMSGPAATIKARRYMLEPLDEEQCQYYIEKLQDWMHQEEVRDLYEHEKHKPNKTLGRKSMSNKKGNHFSVSMAKYDRLSAMSMDLRRRTVPKKGSVLDPMDKRGSKGMTQIEKNTLMRCHKLLVENVNVRDIVPKLTENKVLMPADKIMMDSGRTGADKMKMLLGILPTREHNAFHALSESLKPKYQFIHEELETTKQMTEKENQTCTRLDLIHSLSDQLKVFYKQITTRWIMILWYKDRPVDLGEVYTELGVIDPTGYKVSPENLLSTYPMCKQPRRILLQGESGSGKSSFCKKIINDWSKSEDPIFEDKIFLVMYLDVSKAMTTSLKETLYQQLVLPVGSKILREDFWQLVINHQNRILFIVDGSHRGCAEKENAFFDVLVKGQLRQCYLIWVCTLEKQPEYARFFDETVTCFGFSESKQEQFVRRYSQVSGSSIESFTRLLNKLTCESQVNIRVFAQRPLQLACLCAISEAHMSLNVKTETALFQAFVEALMRLYCDRCLINTSGGKFPRYIVHTLEELYALSFRSLCDRKTVMEAGDPKVKYCSELMLKFGLLHEFSLYKGRNQSVEALVFSHRALQEFLATKHLANLEGTQFNLHRSKITTDPILRNVCKFYCGLKSTDVTTLNSAIINDIFNELAEQNTKQGINSVAQSSKPYDKKKSTGTVCGMLTNYQTSLECLGECNMREDVVKTVGASFPGKVTYKCRDFPSTLGMIGFSDLVRSNCSLITELHLKLDELHHMRLEVLLMVASALQESGHITALQLLWSSKQMLAVFLSRVFGNNTSLRAIRCKDESVIEDSTKTSACVLADMQAACKNMKCISEVSFTYCSNSSLVNNVIRNLLASVQVLNLEGCTLNMSCADELGLFLGRTAGLQSLILCQVTLLSTVINPIMNSLRTNHTVKELNLSETRLDQHCVNAVTEMLRFNSTIVLLNLSKNTLSVENCERLQDVLSEDNKSVQELDLTEISTNLDGHKILRKLKQARVGVIGIQSRDTDRESQTQRELHPKTQTMTFGLGMGGKGIFT